jgi:hypothetical protein
MSVIAVKWCLVKPLEAFMLTDHTISSNPATRRSSQAKFGVSVTGIMILHWSARGWEHCLTFSTAQTQPCSTRGASDFVA